MWRLPAGLAHPLRDPWLGRSTARAPRTREDCHIAEATDLRVEALRATEPLAERRLGVYLHGSLATRDFVPHRSDLDVLAVVRDDSCGEDELQMLGESLRMAPPAVGVDVHVVEERAVRMPERAAVRLLYARVEPDRRFVFAGRTGDLDLTVTCEIIRRTGEALLGPPPADLFAPIPRMWLLAAAKREVEEWLSYERIETRHVAAVQACRVWRLAQDNALDSKLAAGEWGRVNVPGANHLISAALDVQRGGDADIEEPAVRALLNRAREAVLAAS